MERKQLISVVVPVYNVEKYLRQCIDSILSQTYKNIELILVDDGSPDNCGAICDEYQKKYNNIKVIHKENAGLGMARNSGLEIATGDFVYFLDSDDYIADDEIEKMYNAIVANGVDVAITGYTSVNDEGKVLSILKYENEVFVGDEARTKMLPRLIGSSPSKKDSLAMSAAGSMYSLTVIKRNKIKFVSERKMKNEDMVFNVDFLQHSNGGCSINSVGQFYRMNVTSISHRYQPDRFERDKDFYLSMREKLIDLGYGIDVIQRLQRHFFIHILINIKQIKDTKEELRIGEKIKAIRSICQDKLVQNVIIEYPCKELGIKQNIFIMMVKNSMAFPLYLLVR